MSRRRPLATGVWDPALARGGRGNREPEREIFPTSKREYHFKRRSSSPHRTQTARAGWRRRGYWSEMSPLMHQILERISWLFLVHKSAIGGAALCTLTAFAIFGAATLVSSQVSPNLTYRTAPVPVEGQIIGFVGGDSRYHDGVSAYFRTSHEYNWVTVPNFSGCRTGDHIFLDKRGSGKSAEYSLRSPGCLRP
jgi:hypothetical protein